MKTKDFHFFKEDLFASTVLGILFAAGGVRVWPECIDLRCHTANTPISGDHLVPKQARQTKAGPGRTQIWPDGRKVNGWSSTGNGYHVRESGGAAVIPEAERHEETGHRQNKGPVRVRVLDWRILHCFTTLVLRVAVSSCCRGPVICLPLTRPHFPAGVVVIVSTPTSVSQAPFALHLAHLGTRFTLFAGSTGSGRHAWRFPCSPLHASLSNLQCPWLSEDLRNVIVSIDLVYGDQNNSTHQWNE